MDLLEVIPTADIKVIIETLNRIGIANKVKKILYPTCYLQEIEGRYYLCHFKELFMLFKEGAYNNLSEEDIVRRNSIAFCLANWKLIDVIMEDIEPHNKYVFVLPYNDKHDWQVYHKINLKFL